MSLKQDAVRSLADAAQTVDRFSVFRKNQLVTRIEGRLSRMNSVRRDNMFYALDTEQLSRRDFLKVLGLAGAGAVVGAGTLRMVESIDAPIGYATAGDGSDFETIEVASGDTHSVTLGSGDTLSNTLIDISADGARYQINASGSGWEIRNVGVRGIWDVYEKLEPIIVSGDGMIQNIYLGDGAHDDEYAGVTGIYVANKHSGTVRIDRANIQGFPDNAVYGSSPGDKPEHSLGAGGGGTVEFTNSFAANCRASGFRIGTDGSFAENCVAVGCDRNFWGFYNNTKAIDCDFSDGKVGDIGVGDGHWQDNAAVTVENTRFGTTAIHSGRIIGESVGSPQRTKPSEVKGVPLSAQQAASGETNGQRLSGSNREKDTELGPC